MSLCHTWFPCGGEETDRLSQWFPSTTWDLGIWPSGFMTSQGKERGKPARLMEAERGMGASRSWVQGGAGSYAG